MTNRRGNSGKRSQSSAVSEAERIIETMANATADEIIVDEHSRVQFSIGMPAALRIELEQAAKAAGQEASEFALRALASEVGYTGVLGGKRRSSSTLSDEEKKEKANAAAKARREQMNALLAKHGVTVKTRG